MLEQSSPLLFLCPGGGALAIPKIDSDNHAEDRKGGLETRSSYTGSGNTRKTSSGTGVQHPRHAVQ